ncbi:hypothetical protein COB11_05480 [Candidatus Aerophobetes bacterium]|uniref:FeoB-associated Cys-rich membrane protein n=1 Tax=Aerophobetes bacterium TaxID=2030807 RepID=A0A2A4YGB5_UNCAE|nr:MAG: hypothetical protein COB11_05480 [Candidatus Aerophobetes bacterium]
MSTFTLTIILATIVVILCAIGLAIGKILTGTNKFSCKRCGKPEEKKDCSLCKKKCSKKKDK